MELMKTNVKEIVKFVEHPTNDKPNKRVKEWMEQNVNILTKVMLQARRWESHNDHEEMETDENELVKMVEHTVKYEKNIYVAAGLNFIMTIVPILQQFE